MTSPHRPVALVTGASAGLGAEFARQLAAGGHDIVLVARDAARLEAAAAQLRAQHGVNCEVCPADLSVDDDVARVVARIDASPIDVLVNNAGFGTRGGLVRVSRESQEAMVRVHVLAVARLTQAASQSMGARGQGTIINVASVAAFLTSPGNVNYCATKTYQRVFAEALAMELEGRGVYVQALCPGFTHTEFHQRGAMDKTRYPSWAWFTAQRVVAESLEAVRRRRPVVVIPGRRYRAAVFLLRYMPAWLRRRVTKRYRRDRIPTPATTNP
jgi:short-subunit dehydrogenase